MLDWEWYDDINTKVLFIHLLIKANWKEKKWRGIKIKRWQILTWRIILSEETWLTQQQVRTSLNKLKSTNNITIKPTNKYSIIEVLNYNSYQQNNQQTTEQATNNQPTSNQQVTTTKKVKNNKNNKKVKNKYWEYKNILLTQNEKNKLIEDYWESIFNDYIKILDEWIEMKWYKYKNHNLAIRNWIKRDKWESSVTSWISNDYEKQKAERLARYWIKD